MESNAPLRPMTEAPRDETTIAVHTHGGTVWGTWWDAESGLWLANEEYDPETMIAPRDEPVELDERDFTGWRPQGAS